MAKKDGIVARAKRTKMDKNQSSSVKKVFSLLWKAGKKK